MNPLFQPLLKQSFKSSGVYLLIIALVLAISATTALKFSNEQIQNAVALQAAEMLAADLVLSDNQPLEKSGKTKPTNSRYNNLKSPHLVQWHIPMSNL